MLKSRTISDTAIIEGVLGGHRNQYSLLVEKYLPTAYAVAYGRTGNHADAEDVAQDAFLHAFRGLDNLREREKFEGWLITIVRNVANKLWNKRKREGRQQPTVASVATPDMAQRELHAMLRQHIEQLDVDQRDILMLHYFAGKSTRELGQLLGISRDAAKKRLQRAREALSKDLLANLAEGVAPERPLKEQSKAITKTVLASVAAWELSKSGAVAVASTAVVGGSLGGAVATKIGLVAATILLVLAGGWYSTREIEEAEVAKLVTAEERDAPAPSNDSASTPPDDSAQGAQGDATIAPNIEDRATEEMPPKSESTSKQLKLRDSLAEDGVLEALMSLINVEFTDVYLSKLLGYISREYDANIAVDERVVAAEPKRGQQIKAFTPEENYITDGMIASFNVRDVTLLAALEDLLYPLGLDFVEEPGFLWISSPDSIAREVQLLPEDRYNDDIATTLQEQIILEFKDIHLGEMLDYIRTEYDINLVVDYRAVMPEVAAPPPPLHDNPPPQPIPSPTHNSVIIAKAEAKNDFVTNGIIHTIFVSDVQIRDMLTAVLRPLNLAYAIEGNFVWISSPEKLANEDFNAPDTGGASEQLVDALNQTDNFEFEDTSVAAFLSMLQDIFEIPALVDARVVSRNAPVVRNFRARDTVIHNALSIFLRKVGLAYALDGDHIVVSTPEFLEAGIPEDMLAPPTRLKRAIVRR